MRTLRILLLAAALTMMGTMAWSYPNINATTGLVAVPTADVAATGTLQGAADVFFFSDTVVNGRALYGLAGPFEVGAALILGNNNAFGVTGKYRGPGTIAGFNWAAGASLVSGDETGDGWQVFLTGTRAIGPAATRLRGTLGVNFTDLEHASAVRPFAGAQLALGSMTELGGEFVLEAGDFKDSITSIYVRHRFTSRLAGEVGFTNALGFTATGDHDIFAGALLNL